MIAYQVTVNGEKVVTAAVRQGVVSAIANWVFVPSDVMDTPSDWSASFSLAGLDDVCSEDLKWFRRDLKVGDEITLKLIETDEVDAPVERSRKTGNNAKRA